MPHRRRKKQEADTKVIFDAKSSILYLSVISISEDTLQVPLDTFLVLSVLKYTGAEELCNVQLVQQQASSALPVLVRRESVKFKMSEEAAPKPVANCRLGSISDQFI
jgi:hypothetical protein